MEAGLVERSKRNFDIEQDSTGKRSLRDFQKQKQICLI